MLEIRKKTEIAKELWIDYHTVGNNKKKFIPIAFRNSQTNYNWKWYSIRYIEVDKIIQYLKDNKITIFNEKK
jgi:uncharacterized membrane protein